MQHPLYEAARRAYSNTSHDPERRAASWCEGYAADVAKLAAKGLPVDRLERLALAWLAAKSRCASAMITGPARFPLARQEKAWASERKHGEAYYAYLSRCLNPPKPRQPPLSLQQRLATARAEQAKMAALKPSERGHAFALTYATTGVSQLERAAAAVERLAPPEGARYQADASRVWFTFDGKPPEATRNLLKASGFKWTPSKGHWGRLLTPNALAAAARVAKQLEA